MADNSPQNGNSFNAENQENNNETESIIDYDKIDEKSEEDLINDINENDSIKIKIKNKIRFFPMKYYFLIALVIFIFGYILALNNNNIDNNIVFPKWPTNDSLFVQLNDGNLLKIGGYLTEPARLKIGSDTFVSTSFVEIYNVSKGIFLSYPPEIKIIFCGNKDNVPQIVLVGLEAIESL